MHNGPTQIGIVDHCSDLFWLVKVVWRLRVGPRPEKAITSAALRSAPIMGLSLTLLSLVDNGEKEMLSTWRRYLPQPM